MVKVRIKLHNNGNDNGKSKNQIT